MKLFSLEASQFQSYEVWNLYNFEVMKFRNFNILKLLSLEPSKFGSYKVWKLYLLMLKFGSEFICSGSTDRSKVVVI